MRLALIDRFDLHNITRAVQDWGCLCDVAQWRA
jgi:hypothetical protein